MDKTEGFQCLGHSNWISCSPLSQFCSGKFSTFSISYWGSNSYYPRGLIMGVGRISPFPIWMRLRGFSAWGIQTRAFAACWANFVRKFFQLFDLYTGEPNSNYPRGREAEKEKRESARNGWATGVSLLLASKLDHLQPLEPKLLQKISAIPTFILGAPFSYYPRELKMDKVKGKEQKCKSDNSAG